MLGLIIFTIFLYTGIMAGILAKLHSPTAIKIIEMMKGHRPVSIRQKQQNYEEVLSTR